MTQTNMDKARAGWQRLRGRVVSSVIADVDDDAAAIALDKLFREPAADRDIVAEVLEEREKRKAFEEGRLLDPIHPAPAEFSATQIESDPILRYFHYTHLPEPLREVSARFCRLAGYVVATLPRNPERTVALRKLLEAKDCAVRTLVK